MLEISGKPSLNTRTTCNVFLTAIHVITRASTGFYQSGNQVIGNRETSPLNIIGFGGGCHWCTEAVFLTLNGVNRVEQGYIRSTSPDDAFSEAVTVSFDPVVIGLSDLVEIHLHTHASTSQHSMREIYRSAVYVFSAEQREVIREILFNLSSGFCKPIITKVLMFGGFRPSEEKYHNYFWGDQEKPFCKNYIDPKIDLLRSRYSKFMLTDGN